MSYSKRKNLSLSNRKNRNTKQKSKIGSQLKSKERPLWDVCNQLLFIDN